LFLDSLHVPPPSPPRWLELFIVGFVELDGTRFVVTEEAPPQPCGCMPVAVGVYKVVLPLRLEKNVPGVRGRTPFEQPIERKSAALFSERRP
jgi:hypothetical protein